MIKNLPHANCWSPTWISWMIYIYNVLFGLCGLLPFHCETAIKWWNSIFNICVCHNGTERTVLPLVITYSLLWKSNIFWEFWMGPFGQTDNVWISVFDPHSLCAKHWLSHSEWNHRTLSFHNFVILMIFCVLLRMAICWCLMIPDGYRKSNDLHNNTTHWLCLSYTGLKLYIRQTWTCMVN